MRVESHRGDAVPRRPALGANRGPEQRRVEAQVAALADEGLDHSAANALALGRCRRLVDALEGR